MRPKMIFKIGLSFIVLVAVMMYYIINSKKDLVSMGQKKDDHIIENMNDMNKDHGVEDGAGFQAAEVALDASVHVAAGAGGQEKAGGGDKSLESAPKDAAHDAAQNVAHDAAENTADADARNSAHDAARNAAHDAARNSAHDTARNAHDASHDAVYDAAHNGAKDQLPEELQSLKPEFTSRHPGQDLTQSMHLCVVACGDERLEETIVLLKSAVMFSKRHLVFHVFGSDELRQKFKKELDFWPKESRDKMVYNIYALAFPSSDRGNWKTLFKPCAAQRLFLPDLLTSVDSLLYVDTDVLFLTPVDEVYDFFQRFNSSQLAGVAPEHEDKATGWYNRFARHPYYGVLGVNSGVMLMNLTRLRASGWAEEMVTNYQEYKLKIPWGDQDLINIYFHFHPDELFVFPCEWNYRPDHCMYMSVCKGAHQEGAYVLHGARRVWHNDKMPAFAAVYAAFREFRFGEDLRFGLLKAVKNKLATPAVTKSSCGKVGHIFAKQLEARLSGQD